MVHPYGIFLHPQRSIYYLPSLITESLCATPIRLPVFELEGLCTQVTYT